MKTVFTLALSFFVLNTHSAFAVPGDLAGTWAVDANCLLIGDNMDHTAPGVIVSQQYYFAITWQDQGFFKGYSCDATLPNGIFLGVIDGRKIHAADWASTMSGTLNGQGNVMEFIVQNLPGNPDSVPGTCTGTARKIADTVDCDPL